MHCSTLHFGSFVLGILVTFTSFAATSPVHTNYLPPGSSDDAYAYRRSAGRVEIHGHGRRPHTSEYIDLPSLHLRAQDRDIPTATTPPQDTATATASATSIPSLSLPPYPAGPAGQNDSVVATGSLQTGYSPAPTGGIPIPDPSRSSNLLVACGDQRYSHAAYTCYTDKLCPLMNGEVTKPCGKACYLPRQYRCKDGTLENIGQGEASGYPGISSIPPNQTPTDLSYPTPLAMPTNFNYTPSPAPPFVTSTSLAAGRSTGTSTHPHSKDRAPAKRSPD